MNLRRIYQKNRLEIQALAKGRLPQFILHGGAGGRLRELLAFVFHGVDPDRFERQLAFLDANGYSTLSGDELARTWTGTLGAGLRPGITIPSLPSASKSATDPARVPSAAGQRESSGHSRSSPWQGAGVDRAVALTFDDATWTFWAFAYPLLARHKMKAILFAIPGLVPEGPRHANLADTWSGNAPLKSVRARARTFPLCTWSELEEMHASGWVDIQSHSCTHQRVAISPKVVGFQHPGFDADYYGNVLLPLSGDEDPRAPKREVRLGAPILESQPRLLGLPRYKEPAAVASALVSYVAAQGGAVFFQRSNWERELWAKLADIAGPQGRIEGGTFETKEECAELVRFELAHSRQLLEARFPGHPVRHFCYPWFAGSDLSDRIAHEVGYETLHYGIEPRLEARFRAAEEPPFRIARISEEYLVRLPGRNRTSLSEVWSDRILKRGHPRGLEG